ncbi:c-type cytochrome [Ferviditalea candida]|uniref:Cytochrome c n=1 Tax=Ferviditalea candida TaxID=3108399 RepID=A0ABU5ZMG1_9BACL|nr:cytochrome c [Paenibacillaceae bacterium T2]
MLKKITVYTGALLLMIAMLSACGAKTDNQVSPQPSPGATQGADQGAAPGGKQEAAKVDVQAIYTQKCVTCHGTDLEGKLGGKTNLQHVGATLTKDQIATQISNGGNGMLAFKGTLSEDEIEAMAEWLAAKK